jgi:GNAT superfamily N-acetyltransferase
LARRNWRGRRAHSAIGGSARRGYIGPVHAIAEPTLFATLPCGARLAVRGLTAGDLPCLIAGLERLSPASRMQRFFFDKRRYSEEELQRLAAGSDDRQVALGAAIADEAGREIEPVAVARCTRSDSDPAVAEVAFTTIDAWQQHGIGTVLLGALAERAWEAGIRRWRAVFTTDNIATPLLLERVGGIVLESLGPGFVEAICELRPPVAVLHGAETSAGTK